METHLPANAGRPGPKEGQLARPDEMMYVFTCDPEFHLKSYLHMYEKTRARDHSLQHGWQRKRSETIQQATAESTSVLPPGEGEHSQLERRGTASWAHVETCQDYAKKWTRQEERKHRPSATLV